MLRIHLIDGTYELFRCFYGSPSKVTSTGSEVGATVTFVRSMLRLLQEDKATHIACAFDHVITSFRNSLFDGYKTGENIDSLILSQFELIEQATEAIGVTYWPMIEFEADDALASAARKLSANPNVSQILICTPDKDLAQCVKEQRVVCFDRRKGVIIDEAGVSAKYGINPESIPDWLALVGDRSDGIPGISGWGKKSAATILLHYKHLEQIPKRPDELVVQVRGAQRLIQNLYNNWESAQLYRDLATLRTDVQLDVELKKIKWKGVPKTLFKELCLEVEELDLLNIVKNWVE